jgi:hypothetical protein
MKRDSSTAPTDNRPGRFQFTGLWRDGKSLVIDLAEHHFLRRCLKSNEAVELPFETVMLTLHSPATAELRLLQDDPRKFARVRYTVHSGPKQHTRIKFELPLPLSPRWQAILRSRWGARLLFVGAAMLLGTYFLWVKLHNTFDWAWIPQLSLFLSLLVLLAGGVFQLFVHQILTVGRLYDGKIWVGGVHPAWLGRLPEYIPSRRMLKEEVQLLGWSFWICASVGLFLLGLFLASRLRDTGDVKEAEYRYMRFALLTGAAAALLMGNRARTLLLGERKKLEKHYPVLDRKTYQRLRGRKRKQQSKRSR